MVVCIKDNIQNLNIVIGCTVGCDYCYARNNVRRWHIIDDFAKPEFFLIRRVLWNAKNRRIFFSRASATLRLEGRVS